MKKYKHTCCSGSRRSRCIVSCKLWSCNIDASFLHDKHHISMNATKEVRSPLILNTPCRFARWTSALIFFDSISIKLSKAEPLIFTDIKSSKWEVLLLL